LATAQEVAVPDKLRTLTASAGFTYRLYIGLSLGPQRPRGPPKTVVRIESMAGI